MIRAELSTPMRGQKLFVRPLEPADAAGIDNFLAAEKHPPATPSLGLIGKVVGEIVALVSLERETDALRVTNVFVARELRRKRIGRYMLTEAAQLARGMNVPRLVVDAPAGAAEFLRRVGFVEEEGRMVRWVQ
jgi:GNAT superfamily N-acetyltransferase